MIKDKQLVGLSLSVFLLMLGDGMVLALLPQKTMALTNSSFLVSCLASTYALAQIVSQLPFGLLADKMGCKLFLVAGYILSFLAALLYFSADHVYLIFLARILQGIGEAPILALAPALLSVKYANDKGKMIGIYNASIYLGLTVGPLVGLLLFEPGSDSRIFLFYAIMCLFGAVIISLSVGNRSAGPATEYNTTAFTNISGLLKNPYTLLVLCSIALYGGAQGIFMTVIPTFLITVKSFNQFLIGIFFSLFNVAITLSQLITGTLSDKLGRRLFMITGLILAAVGLQASTDFDGFGLIIVLSASSLGLGVFYLSSMTFMNETVPASLKGTISGAYYLFWGIGMLAGPMLLANYAEFRGYASAIQIVVVSLVLAAIMLLVFPQRRLIKGNEIQINERRP